MIKVAEWAEYYTNVLKGLVSSADHSVQALKDRAKSIGLTYRHVEQQVSADIEDAVAMLGPGLELLSDLTNPDSQLIATIGGTAEPPAMTMRQALEQFESDSTDMWLNLASRTAEKAEQVP